MALFLFHILFVYFGTMVSPGLSDSTACQSFPACIYYELSPHFWKHKYFHQSHLMVLVVWIAGKITDWMSGRWYNEGFGSNLVMSQVQTKLFVGTEASQEDILQVYQRSSQIFSSNIGITFLPLITFEHKRKEVIGGNQRRCRPSHWERSGASYEDTAEVINNTWRWIVTLILLLFRLIFTCCQDFCWPELRAKHVRSEHILYWLKLFLPSWAEVPAVWPTSWWGSHKPNTSCHLRPCHYLLVTSSSTLKINLALEQSEEFNHLSRNVVFTVRLR